MKKLLVLLTTFCVVHGSFSQDYIPMLGEANEWHVQFDVGFGLRSNSVRIEGEETINDIVYKQVFFNDFNNPSCYLREENEIVYLLDDPSDTELVFLDFTLEVGDSFFLLDPYNGFCLRPPSPHIDELRVMDIQTEFIANRNRRVLQMEYYYNDTPAGEGELWIEGIGSTGYIGPRGFDYDNYFALACFTRDGETTMFNGASQCEILGVTDFIKERIYIYPNPVVTTSTLRLPSEVSADQVKIFSIQGTLIKSETITADNLEIHNSDFSSGLYFYQVFSNNVLIKTDKIIIS